MKQKILPSKLSSWIYVPQPFSIYDPADVERSIVAVNRFGCLRPGARTPTTAHAHHLTQHLNDTPTPSAHHYLDVSMRERKKGESSTPTMPGHSGFPQKRKQPEQSEKGEERESTTPAKEANHSERRELQSPMTRLEVDLSFIRYATQSLYKNKSSDDDMVPTSEEDSNSDDGRPHKRPKDAFNTNQDNGPDTNQDANQDDDENLIIEDVGDDTDNEDALQGFRRVKNQEDVLEEVEVCKPKDGRSLKNAEAYMKSLTLDGLIDRRIRASIATINNARLRFALRTGVTALDLRFDEDDLLLRWGRMGSYVVQAAANNTLGEIIAEPIDWNPATTDDIPVVTDLTSPETAHSPSARWISKELKKEVQNGLSYTGPQPQLCAIIREWLEPEKVELDTLFGRLHDLNVGVLGPLQRIRQFLNQEIYSNADREAIEKRLPLTLLKFFGAIDIRDRMPPDTAQHWTTFTKDWMGPEKTVSHYVSMMIAVWRNPGYWVLVKPIIALLMAMPSVVSVLEGGLRAWGLVKAEKKLIDDAKLCGWD
ncbi:hypothetical protein G7Z17_g6501 [Cylindrodendrum hubeiense]|uniref:Uncharacterized protein n=1 Tax=Cylindrodendrum hubeiense TaxID=595255 RepID=A0A9P5HD29_9HYPO|nr:hypothetical protein G7Z17_g6501 [Cylindrodendrum hubeiense]